GAGQGVQSVLLGAGHRGDGAVLRRALAHEQRKHEIRRAQRVRAQQGAHRGARAQPARAIDRAGEGREGHRNSFGSTEREDGEHGGESGRTGERGNGGERENGEKGGAGDRKSTRLNSSHAWISYPAFCWRKKKITTRR